MGTDDVRVFMPIVIGDYLRDTMHLVAEEHGAYLLLLMQMWIQGGDLPNDPELLASMARVPLARWESVWKVIRRLVIETDDGRVTQKRLRSELKLARERKKRRVEASRHAANSRWGNENMRDASESQSESNASACPSSSSSPSSSPDGEEDLPAAVAIPEGLRPLHEDGTLQDLYVALALSRRTGKIADSMWEKALAKLSTDWPLDIVRQGITLYLDGAHHMDGKRENYLFGICRSEKQRRQRRAEGRDRRPTARSQTPGHTEPATAELRCPFCTATFPEGETDTCLTHIWTEHPEKAEAKGIRKPRTVAA